MRILVTGGCGFIGSHFIREHLKSYPDDEIVNLDKLTYAGRQENLQDIEKDPRYIFIHGDIGDSEIVNQAINGCDQVVHFAAETQVDKAIVDPSLFLKTNVMGTHALLEAARKQDAKKFVNISTDEVYGHILEGSFTEKSLLNPRNPYAASKAGGERLAYAYSETYGLDVSITRCSNNFGPYQYPDKVIPVFVIKLLNGQKVPLYGDGQHVRDWLYVLDHCLGIELVREKGKKGEVYNIGGGTEMTNRELTLKILALMGKKEDMIHSVPDRPGHDRRYSLDITKIQKELGFTPQHTLFDQKLKETIDWYVAHPSWWTPLLTAKASFVPNTMAKVGERA
ncbi:MAG: dTDP-glucose 4,6-dehydratase [Candidatus Diapherotrites archaeon]|nr:dTDP-glucose 4,6-dehydratase [Candidatus Diapherotrites archaeon]MDZ4256544.1 dTDP-glucose 4,6-dehydratase [archaeon]